MFTPAPIRATCSAAEISTKPGAAGNDAATCAPVTGAASIMASPIPMPAMTFRISFPCNHRVRESGVASWHVNGACTPPPRRRLAACRPLRDGIGGDGVCRIHGSRQRTADRTRRRTTFPASTAQEPPAPSMSISSSLARRLDKPHLPGPEPDDAHHGDRQSHPESEQGTLPTPEAFAAMDRYTDELVAAGILVAGAGLKPSSQASGWPSTVPAAWSPTALSPRPAN